MWLHFQTSKQTVIYYHSANLTIFITTVYAYANSYSYIFEHFFFFYFMDYQSLPIIQTW